jgi:hypothetical protein
MVIKLEAEERKLYDRRVFILYSKRNIAVRIAAYISKTFYYLFLKGPEACSTIVTPTLQFRTSASAL